MKATNKGLNGEYFFYQQVIATAVIVLSHR